MRVSIVRPHELGAAELLAWQAMQRTRLELLNPFLSPGFVLAVGRARPSARVAVLEEGQQVVGFFPFEQAPLRIGRPIGAGVSDAQALIHAPGLEWSAQELLRACRLDVWEFDHLIGAQIAGAGGRVVRCASPIIDVSGGYEKYVAERLRTSLKIFRSTLYKGRKLERDLGPTRFEFDARDADALRVLLRWKSNQYRRTGRRDRFAAEWIRKLVWDLFESRSDGCAGTLSAMYLGERVVAAHFGLRSPCSLSCWFPSYDVELARYSPGLSLHLSMARAAAEIGIDHLDLGKGDEGYKQSLKTGDLTVGEGRVGRGSVGAVVLAARRGPTELASNFVLRHPLLRRSARRTLRRIGSLRLSI